MYCNQFCWILQWESQTSSGRAVIYLCQFCWHMYSKKILSTKGKNPADGTVGVAEQLPIADSQYLAPAVPDPEGHGSWKHSCRSWLLPMHGTNQKSAPFSLREGAVLIFCVCSFILHKSSFSCRISAAHFLNDLIKGCCSS